MEQVRIVDLLRHGETAGDSGRFRGCHDDPLSETGWQQMWSVAGESCPWQAVVSSPSRRCRNFAEALAARHGLPLHLEADFRELDFGRWEGRRVAEVLAEDPLPLQRFWEDPARFPPPGGESPLACRDRVMAGWWRWLAGTSARHSLVITHGGPIRILLASLLGIPWRHSWRLEIPHAGLSRWRIHGTGRDCLPILVFLNADRPR